MDMVELLSPLGLVPYIYSIMSVIYIYSIMSVIYFKLKKNRIMKKSGKREKNRLNTQIERKEKNEKKNR